MLYLIPFLHQTTTLRICIFFNNQLYLIPFLHQTTTPLSPGIYIAKLYLIPFLHQTTTRGKFPWFKACCILFHFYIKPQRTRLLMPMTDGCILFHFYIKPQPITIWWHQRLVVSYSISTSNHNWKKLTIWSLLLYLIPFLHQTTTDDFWRFLLLCCILFHFYIKPQHNGIAEI